MNYIEVPFFISRGHCKLVQWSGVWQVRTLAAGVSFKEAIEAAEPLDMLDFDDIAIVTATIEIKKPIIFFIFSFSSSNKK